MVSGSASYILPSFNNSGYIKISIGDKFGLIDITGSTQVNNIEESDWFFNCNLLRRQFSVMATNKSELLALDLNTIHEMN